MVRKLTMPQETGHIVLTRAIHMANVIEGVDFRKEVTVSKSSKLKGNLKTKLTYRYFS